MDNKKLNVWLVNQYAVPTSMPGITRHFELITEWQKHSDINVLVWLSHFNYSLRRFLTNDEISNIGRGNPKIGLNWIWSFPHKLNNWKRIINMISFTMLFFLKALVKKKPDVIIASSPQLFVAYAALLIAKMFKIKFILEVRDLWPGSLIAMGGIKPGLILKLLYFIEKELYEKSDHIVTLSGHQKEYLTERGVNLRKITLVPNGVLIGSWEKPKDEVLMKYRSNIGLNETDFIAVYTGAHGTANSLDQLVEAGKYLAKNEYIVLIGDGPEKVRLMELKKSLNINQVIFMDPVPKNEILNYTAMADCGIISLEDNDVFRGARPNKLFDYMFLGKPIISTISGEVELILKENKVGFYAGTQNPEGLVNKMRTVKSFSVQELNDVKDNGMKYIMNEGNRTASAKVFLNLIYNIANKQ